MIVEGVCIREQGIVIRNGSRILVRQQICQIQNAVKVKAVIEITSGDMILRADLLVEAAGVLTVICEVRLSECEIAIRIPRWKVA